jgi:hypothetical protein
VTCIVCNQKGAKIELIDGFQVRVCEKCRDDDFRRPVAVQRAREEAERAKG